MDEYRILDLFSGIGGFSLGLERVEGFKTIAFCESDKHCRKVLRKHWNNVPIYEDIKELTYERLKADGVIPTIITSGFPCQNLSVNGKAEGLGGSKSSLFFEVVRLVRMVRPRFCILENVSALLARGMGDVLGEFSKIGYDCEWHCISASSIGAPHERDRIWIVGYPDSTQRTRGRSSERVQSGQPESHLRSDCRKARAILDYQGFPKEEAWNVKSSLDRVINGIPRQLDRHRLRQLGNALVPDIPEYIGRSIIKHEKEQNHNEQKTTDT